MFDVGSWVFRLLPCLIWLLAFELPAQTNPPPQPNPLMQLMVSQPAVDINSPVTVKAVFDPPVVGVGEKAVYRISLNALEPSVRFPQEMGFPHGLESTLSSRGQILQQADKILRPVTAVNFHVRAAHPGLYTVPAFSIEVYGKPVLVPKAYLEVVENLEPDHARARELVLIPSRTNVFVGESVRMRVLLRGSVSNVVQTLTQLQFNGEGFLDDKSLFHQKVEPVEFNGRKVVTWVSESSVTPFAPGKRTLAVQAFTAGMHFMGPVVLSGQATILGGLQQHMLLDSDPVTLQVRPLPSEGATKGFAGFMGNVSLDRALLSTNLLRLGDAVRLIVAFRSDNPLGRLVPPPPPQLAGWQIFPAMPVEPPPSEVPITNQIAAFAYTLIPLTEEVQHTPAIPFSVFDPEKAIYLDLTFPSLAVKVVTEGLPADWQPATWAGQNRSEQKLSLSALAESPGKSVGSLVPLQMRPWFLPLQLAPALVLLGLWSWDRRRRFLESHPELVRRRQARRALRRERRALRRASASGDAPGFARRAITALQIAAAPHFPAEPRALVCGEVLSLFEHPERTGEIGEVIRLFFECDERATFAANQESQSPLFGLQPKLEGILERMEAKL
jgi:hypothetical protein